MSRNCRSTWTRSADYESKLAALVEVPTVSMEPERRTDMQRGAPSRRSTCVPSAAAADVVPTGGHPLVLGPSRDRGAAHAHALQPSRRAAGRPRGRGLAHRALHLHRARRALLGPRHHRRQGPGAGGAVRRARAAHEAGVPRQRAAAVGDRGGDRLAALRGGAAKPRRARSRPMRSSSPTRSGSRAASPRSPPGCAACRASASRSRPGRATRTPASPGGAARNPLAELMALVCELHDAQTGKVKIPGFYDDVREADRRPSATDFLALRLHRGARSRRTTSSRRCAATDALEVDGAIWAGPTFEVHGLAGGYTGPGLKTVVPAARRAEGLVPAGARARSPAKSCALVHGLREEAQPRRARSTPEARAGAVPRTTTGPLADAVAGGRSRSASAASRRSCARAADRRRPLMEQILRAPGRLPGPLAARARLPRAQRELRLGARRRGGMAAFARYFDAVSRL